MNSAKTAQTLKYCGVFLILLIFLPLDLCITLTFSLYLSFHSRNYVKLTVASIVLFLTDIFFRKFDLSILFISDLAIDSYILLLTSLFIYFKLQPGVLKYLQILGRSSRKIFSVNALLMIGISSLFSLLLAPVIGIPFAVITGYISFSYISKQFKGRYAYVAGLFFLFFCPFFIIVKRDNIAENFAIISFYFLIIGTLQEIIRLKQARIGELVAKIKISDGINIQKETDSFAFKLPKINFGTTALHYSNAVRLLQIDNKLMKFIVIVFITAFFSFLVTFFFIKLIYP